MFPAWPAAPWEQPQRSSRGVGLPEQKVGVPAITLGGLADTLPWDPGACFLPGPTSQGAGPVRSGVRALRQASLPCRSHVSRGHLGFALWGGIARNSGAFTIAPL